MFCKVQELNKPSRIPNFKKRSVIISPPSNLRSALFQSCVQNSQLAVQGYGEPYCDAFIGGFKRELDILPPCNNFFLDFQIRDKGRKWSPLKDKWVWPNNEHSIKLSSHIELNKTGGVASVGGRVDPVASIKFILLFALCGASYYITFTLYVHQRSVPSFFIVGINSMVL